MDANVEKQLDAIPVKYFKLMNGDSIISFCHDDLENGVIGLEIPMKVTTDVDQQFMLSPYMPFAQENLHLIDKYNVLIESNVDAEVKAHYIKLALDDGAFGYDQSDSKYLN